LPEDFSFLRRTPIIVHDDYWIEIDEFWRGSDQILLAHLRCAKFSPSIFRRLKYDWLAYRNCHLFPVFAFGEVDDDKFERFVTHLGFAPFSEVTCLNGQVRRLFISKV
jgi:hypothetical protein